MVEATVALGHVDSAGLALVGILATLRWLRGRGQARACVALALGLLAVVSILRQLAPVGHLPAPIAILNLLCFVGSAYALLDLRQQLLPMRAPTRRAVPIALATTTVLAVPVVLGIAPARYVAVVALLVIGLWCACVAEPAVRFWIAARNRPAVQRARLRLLSVAYLALAVALIFAVLGFAGATAITRTTAPPPPVVALVFQAVATSVIPLFAIGFMPPQWLRRVWRSLESDAYREAMLDLVMFASDRATMAGRGLEWAIRFLGGDAGVFVMTDGSPLAFRGMDEESARRLANDIWQRDPRRPAIVSASLAVAPSRGDGRRTWLAVSGGAVSPVFGDDEVDTLALFTDSLSLALDRVLLTQRISEQTQRMETVLAAVAELGGGILVAEKGGRIVDANDAVLRITGYERDELEGMRLVDLVQEADRDEPRARFTQLLELRDPVTFESRMTRKDGGVVDVAAAVAIIVQDGCERIVAMTQDISARKRGEAALSEAARIDPLTGVANRRAWNERLDYTLRHAPRSHKPLCVAMLDLDDFKQFNDDWGHQRGDLLLENAVRLWTGALRDGDFLARLGGDEFAIIMPGCSSGQASGVLMRLIDATPDAVSAGVAQWDGIETGDELVARADAALLRAKREQRGGIVVDANNGATSRSAGLVARIESILDGRFLRSAYQPIVDLERNVVIGHEALLRPSGVAANTSVEELFAAAQRFGYARDLDWLSRRAALEGAASLPADEVLFVNVSSWALLDPVHGSDQMLMLLRWVGRPPEQLVLEISESELITNRQRLRAVLADYRAHGVRFALDDVGEGHSTLEVLAAAEPEYIKVARSLTEHLDESGPSSAVRAIVTFAEYNGADVIAEGISDKQMVRRVRQLGVRYGQGFALGVPRFIKSPAASALHAS